MSDFDMPVFYMRSRNAPISSAAGCLFRRGIYVRHKGDRVLDDLADRSSSPLAPVYLRGSLALLLFAKLGVHPAFSRSFPSRYQLGQSIQPLALSFTPIPRDLR